MKKSLNIQINFTNRAIYTLITFSIFLLIGISVFALTPGVAPNPGHLIEEIAPPLNCEINQVLQWDGSTWICEGDSIPTGAVTAFNLPSCPTGWSELTDARGRYIVGMPSGGTLAAVIGTALSDEEDRAAGTHTHSVYDFWSNNGMTGCSASVNACKKVGMSDDGGLVAGTNAPYIQFLYCVKD
jgi:hypothetical protein